MIVIQVSSLLCCISLWTTNIDPPVISFIPIVNARLGLGGRERWLVLWKRHSQHPLFPQWRKVSLIPLLLVAVLISIVSRYIYLHLYLHWPRCNWARRWGICNTLLYIEDTYLTYTLCWYWCEVPNQPSYRPIAMAAAQPFPLIATPTSRLPNEENVWILLLRVLPIFRDKNWLLQLTARPVL